MSRDTKKYQYKKRKISLEEIENRRGKKTKQIKKL
jgi:hypothetical protein